MQLLQPIYLFLLSGLLLPLAIHLWNKKQGKLIEMGTLRFLKELPKEQINSIQLTQKRLLLLRCIILILPILFLAGLTFQSFEQKNYEAWVLLSPELADDKRITTQLANYNQDSFQIFLSDKLLTPFNLESENSFSQISQPDYAALLERINDYPNKPDSLVIFTTAKIQHFSQVPYSNIPVNWVLVPGDEKEIVAYSAALNLGNDSIKLLQSVSNSGYTTNSWQKKSVNGNSVGEWQINGDSLRLPSRYSLPLQKTDFSVVLLNEDTISQGVIIMKAALRTLNKYLGTHIKVKTLTYEDELPKDDDHYFLIDTNNKVEELENVKSCLVITGNSLMQKGFSVQEKGILPLIYLDTEAERQDAKLVTYLASLLFPIKKHLTSFDNRILADKQLKEFKKSRKSDTKQLVYREKQSNLASQFGYYLLGLCIILIGWERWLSLTK